MSRRRKRQRHGASRGVEKQASQGSGPQVNRSAPGTGAKVPCTACVEGRGNVVCVWWFDDPRGIGLQYVICERCYAEVAKRGVQLAFPDHPERLFLRGNCGNVYV
jgi:hypothetical protein